MGTAGMVEQTVLLVYNLASRRSARVARHSALSLPAAEGCGADRLASTVSLCAVTDRLPSLTVRKGHARIS